jgi:glycosyltransferase involved in cell wall biosynthesis
MRIVLASIHPQSLSGQITGLRGLATQLSGIGQQVKIVSAVPLAPIPIGTIRPAPQARKSIVSRASIMVRALRRLVQDSDGADLVHVNLPTPAFAPVGDLLQAILPIPVVVGFDAHLADSAWACRKAVIRDPRFYAPRLLVNNALLARWPSHRCPRYIVSSDAGRAELSRLGFPGDAVRVLPNVVDLDEQPRMTQADARRGLGLPEAPLISYLGHYHHVKGVDILVEAFARVSEAGDDCRLVLAWSGLGDSTRIERHIHRLGLSERVIRLGRVPVASLFSAADVVVLPYLSAMGQCMFPAVLLEAIQVGIPIVTSDLADFRCLFRDGPGASLVPVGDVEAVAAEVRRLLEDRQAREAMVAAQRDLFRTRLNPQSVARDYLRVYHEACEVHASVSHRWSRAPRDSARGCQSSATASEMPERSSCRDGRGQQ